MSEPTLTEALSEALTEADSYGYGLRDRDLPRQLGFVIAPFIDQARAEAVAATTKYDDLRHRIEALHQVPPHPDGMDFPWCGACGREWPCPTIRAIEATP